LSYKLMTYFHLWRPRDWAYSDLQSFGAAENSEEDLS
jgi:hypothetical protein